MGPGADRPLVVCLRLVDLAPDFEPAECRPARVAGFHRCLKMRSCTNRGSPRRAGFGSGPGIRRQLPGPGLSGAARAQVRRCWPNSGCARCRTASMSPRWLTCSTRPARCGHWRSRCLGRAPTGRAELTDAELIHILRHAQGRYGTTLDYVDAPLPGCKRWASGPCAGAHPAAGLTPRAQLGR